MKTIVSTGNAPAAIGTYSQAVTINGPTATTYLSGQIPLDPTTMQLVSGFENQVKQVFENLRAVCEAAGGSLNHLVKVNVYLLDLAHFAKVNEIMATYIQTPYPARAAVAVAGLPRGAEIEIEGVMVVEVAGSTGG
ncbi:MAG: RidA family protein [Burkholderiales bacterium]